jgi:hypothetical protein
VADDPLYGDRPKPPIVPMTNSEVITFDVIRGLDGASPARRWLVLGGVTAAFALIGVLTRLATSTSSVARVRVRAETPRQTLSYLCAQYRTRIGTQLSTDGDIGGPTPNDLHRLCAT